MTHWYLGEGQGKDSQDCYADTTETRYLCRTMREIAQLLRKMLVRLPTLMRFVQTYLFSAETYAEDLKESGSHDWCRKRKGQIFW